MLGLFQMEIHLMLICYYFVEAANICSILMTLMLICVKISTTQQCQASKLLKHCLQNFHLKSSSKIRHQLNKYFNYHTKCLISLLDINKVFGKILLFAIVVDTPISTFLIISIWHNQILAITQLAFAILIINGQICTIFCLHWIGIKSSIQLHKCGKHLFAINVENIKQNMLSLRMQLKLNYYLFKFHTNKKYGITYGPCGIATFRSFSKV